MLTQKINFKKMNKDLMNSRVKKLQIEGNNIEAGIVNRTLQGKDMFLKAFKKYTKGYASFRSKNGRKSTVNLTYTGQMLGAITSDNIPDGLKFKFSSKSESEKAAWNNKTRKFFGTDKTQREYLKKKLSKL